MARDEKHSTYGHNPLNNDIIRHNVLGLQLDYLSPDYYIPKIVEKSRLGIRGYCCVANVHMCVLAHDDAQFANIVNSATFVIPDSTILERARSISHAVNFLKTLRGAEIMMQLCQRAALEGVKVAFIGGKDDEALALLSKMALESIPTLDIAFAFSPPFSVMSEVDKTALRLDIEKSGAQLVFVGLGCPKQERWMADNSQLPAMMIGVGAAFDFNSGLVRKSPVWVHQVGLEWLYRLVKEPRRLWRRYLSTSPRFLWLLFLDRLKNNKL